MKIKIFAVFLFGTVLGIGIIKLFIFPFLICDDFTGGPIGPAGGIRGITCDCNGWKLYLANRAPEDGRDLSLCFGSKTETREIR